MERICPFFRWMTNHFQNPPFPNIRSRRWIWRGLRPRQTRRRMWLMIEMLHPTTSNGHSPIRRSAPRPTPTVVYGDIVSTGFDLRQCTYLLKVKAPKAAPDESPTIVYLPEYHFPK